MASTFRLILPLLTLGLSVAAACSSEDEPRRGGLGASCASTDDCEEPLSCIQLVCGGPTSPTTSSGETGGAGGGGAGGGVGGSGLGPIEAVGTGDDTGECDACLDSACGAALNACGEACLQLEVCIETQCRSANFEMGEESNCFLDCQAKHPAGVTQHQNVANCSFDNAAFCDTCSGFLTEYPACRNARLGGECAPYHQACLADANCQSYSSCVESCTMASQCIACSGTPDAQAGRELFERVNRCVTLECFSEQWLP